MTTVQPFLYALRDLLRAESAWHPLACANREGRILGEFEQDAPTALHMVPSDSVPAAWNLPCAITYLLRVWELEGAFRDVPVEKTTLRHAVTGLLCRALRTEDLWLITDHGTALRGIESVLGQFAETREVA